MSRFLQLNAVLWFVAAVMSVASILLTFLLHTRAYYPALIWDEWGGIAFFLDKGFWPSVFCLHNDHVVVLPKILTRLLFEATDADPYLRGLSTLLVASALGLVLGYFSSRSAVAADTGRRVVSLGRFSVPLALTVWLVAYQQLYWGMATYSYFSLIFGFGAVASLDLRLNRDEKPGLWLLLPMLLAVASTLSFSYGAAAWGALAALMLLHRRPWWWFLLTLSLGLALMLILRSAMPHCRPPPEHLAPDVFGSEPLVVLQGLFTLVGSAWSHSLAPLLTPSATSAALLGALGLGMLGWLTIQSLRGSHSGTSRLLLTGCMLAAGMLLLVALGRNSASFDIPNQTLAPRFLPLSIFFWSCLLGAFASRPGKTAGVGDAGRGALYAAVASYTFLTALLAVTSVSTMRVGAGELYFSSTEIRLESIRAWVAPERRDHRVAYTLGTLDPELVWDNLEALRQKNWDFYRALPSARFPRSVDELPGETLEAASALPNLTIEKSRESRGGGTWTLNGSLEGVLPPEVRHLFLARGNDIIGYGFAATVPAFVNKPRQPLTGWDDLTARFASSGRRLGQLFGPGRYWNGVAVADPGAGRWRCAWRSRDTLLCFVAGS